MQRLAWKLWNLVRKPRTIRKRPAPPLWRSRLSIEALEDRLVPATLGFQNTPPALISGHVFLDADSNGLQGTNEPSAPGMTVTLTGTTTQGTQVTSTVTTDSSGDYRFFQVAPGTYALTLNPETNLTGPEAIVGALGGMAAGSSTLAITVAQGQAGLNYNFAFTTLSSSSVSLRQLLSSSGGGSGSISFPPAGSGAITVDHTVGTNAKETAGTASLAGTFTNDSSATKDGVTGVELALTGLDTFGRDVFQTTKTDSTGAYSFAKLEAGTYTINVVGYPAGFHADLVGGVGTSPGTSGGLILRNDQITNINLASGATGTGYNFGELAFPTATQSGTLSLTAGLADDTASGSGTATDGVTSDAAIAGRLQHASALTSFEASFGTNFVSIRNQLHANGTFYLNPAVLNQIAGSTLTDGVHTLHLRATDTAGNTVSFDVTFTLDASAPAVPSIQLQNPAPVVTPATSENQFTITYGANGAQSTLTANATNLVRSSGASVTVTATTPGTNTSPAVDTITFTGTFSGGTFTLTQNGITTTPIAWSANRTTLAANIQTALAQLAIPTVSASNSVTAIALSYPLNGAEQMTASGTGLLGTGANVTVGHTTLGTASNPAVDTLFFGGNINGGTFTLTLNGSTTGNITWSSNPTVLTSNIQTALATLVPNAAAGSSSNTVNLTFAVNGAQSMTADGTNLVGGTVSISPTTLGTASTPAVDTVTFSNTVTGGTFTLTLNGITTGPINFSSVSNTLVNNIQTALNQIAPTASPDTVLTATFTIPGNEPTMTAVSSLTGTGAIITVATTTTGTTSTQTVQTLAFGGNITGGTFTLQMNQATTGPITWNATPAVLASNIQAALNQLAPPPSTVSAGITATALNYAVPGAETLTANGTGLTGAGPSVTVGTTTAGNSSTNEIDTLLFANVTGGTFTLTLNGATTNPIVWSATSGTLENNIQTALNQLAPTAAAGSTAGTVTATFQVPGAQTMTADGTNLVGGNVNVTTSTAGNSTTAAVETITFDNTVTGGTFTLTVNGITTAPIQFSTTSTTLVSNIQTALNQLIPAAATDSTAVLTAIPLVNGVQPTFTGTGSGNGLTLGSSGGTITVTTITAGTANTPAEAAIAFGGTINTGSTFALMLDGATTNPITWSPNTTNLVTNIQNALNQLAAPTISAGTKSTAIALTYSTNGTQTLSADGTGLTGTDATVSVGVTTPGTASTPEVDTIFFGGDITGGNFTLTLNGNSTGNIVWSSDAATLANHIQTALGALATTTVDTIVTAAFPLNGVQPVVTANTTGLSGTGATVTVGTATAATATTPAVLAFAFGGTINSGTFTLTVDGLTTPAITWSSNPAILAANIQTALNLLAPPTFSGATTSAGIALNYQLPGKETLTASGTNLTGTGVSVSVATTTAGNASTAEVDTLLFGGNVTGGTFTLTLNGATTTPIAFSTDPATLTSNIAAELADLVPTLAIGSTAGTFTATFQVPGAQTMTASSSLTGGNVTVTTTKAGNASTDAVETITFDSGVTGGTFTLTVNGITTSAINWSASPSTLLSNIEAALNKLVPTAAADTVVTATFPADGTQTGVTVNGSGLTGTGASATVATLTPGTPATALVQAVAFGGSITGGTFTLSFGGLTTGPITWSSDPATLAADMEAAVNALTTSLSGATAGASSSATANTTTFTATFASPGSVSQMTVPNNNLTGTGASVSVSTTTSGNANTDEVQTITFNGSITGGTFTLGLNGAISQPIAWSANPTTLAANIQSALALLASPTVSASNNALAIALSYPLNGKETLAVNGAGLTGTGANATVAVTQTGAAGTPEVDTVFFNGNVTGGTFTLTLNGSTTGNITWNSNAASLAANIQTALATLVPGVAQGMSAGTFTASFQVPGPQTMSADGTNLTGGGVSVSTTTTGDANTDAVETITFDNTVSGGSFTLTVNGITTGPIAFSSDATTLASNIQTALDQLIPAANTDTVLTATFQANGTEPTMTANGTNLTGSGASVTVATITPGTATSPAVQAIAFGGTINAGSTFTLTANGAPTGPISWNSNAAALAANIQSALGQLTGALANIQVAPTGGSTVVNVTMGYNGTQSTMTANASGLQGTNAAVSVVTQVPGTSTTPAVQSITFTGQITGGTFTLTFNGETTAPITWSSDSATLIANIQSALTALLGSLPDTNGIVELVGKTEPGATVVLTPSSGTSQTTTAAGDGSFDFHLTLTGGASSFVLQATDNAGNASQLSTILVNPVAVTVNSSATTSSSLNTPTSSTSTGNDQTFDLDGVFNNNNASNSLVTVNTSAGPVTVQLFDNSVSSGNAPVQTVDNFFNYINSGAYTNDIFHRLASNPVVLQGGGFNFLTNPNEIVPVATNPQILNEFNSNVLDTLGTLAMAKQGGNPNSATSQFFFNTGDNSTSLNGSNNGGFAVFGKILSPMDQRILDTLDSYPVVPQSPPIINISFSNTGPEPTITADTTNLKGTKPSINIVTNSPGTTATGSFQATSAVQTMTFAGGISGGSFKLTFNGQTTDAITWNSDLTKLAGDIQTALNKLTSVKVTVTKSTEPFSQLPLKNYTGTSFPSDVTAGNLDMIKSIAGQQNVNGQMMQRSDHLTYKVLSNDNTAAVSATVDANDWLQVHPLAAGSAHVTVQATDQYGATATVTYTFTVANPVTIPTKPANQTNSVGDTVTTSSAVQVTATSSPAGTITYSATGLPDGLSIGSTNGLITGTIKDDAANGVQTVYNVTVTATSALTGGGGTSSATTSFTWTVNPVIAFKTPTVAAGQTSGSFTVTFASPGNEPAMTADGTNLTGAGAGVSVGVTTPGNGTTAAVQTVTIAPATTGGTFTLTLNGQTTAPIAWNAAAADIQSALAMLDNIIPNQTNTEGDDLTGTTAVPFPAVTDSNSGKTITYSATGLPDGLSINSSTGLISGTVSASAHTNSPYTVVVTASDGTDSVTQTFTWTINPVVTITATGNQSNQAGNTVSLQVIAGDTAGKTLTYSATRLPSGLKIDSTTGLISGTIGLGANVQSPYHVTVTVKDDTHTNSETFTWTVLPLINVTSISNQTNNQGDAVSLQVVAEDGQGNALSYSYTGLPAGLTMDAAGLISGTIAGTAKTNSPYHTTVTVSDNHGHTRTLSFTWTVHPAVTITAIANQTGKDGDAVSVPVTAQDTLSGPTFTYTATGLPAGLNINSNGVISGTLEAGSGVGSSAASVQSPYHVTVTVKDQNGDSAQVKFTWTVNPNVTITPTGDQQGRAGTAITPVTVQVSDLNSKTVFSASGLPAGLSINPHTGVISGTIAASAGRQAPYSVIVQVTDRNLSTSESFNWTVAPVVQFTTASSPQTNLVGDSVNLTVTATDSLNKKLTYRATNLPAGLSIDAHTGVISGKVAAGADAHSPYHVTVRASDGSFANRITFTWTINPVISITGIGTQTGKDGDTVNLGVTASDASNGAVLTYAVTGLPGGLKINSQTGAITGTIDSGANAASLHSPYNVTVTVTDQNNNTSHITFTWNVSPVVSITKIANQTNVVGDTIPAIPPAPQVVAGSTAGTFVATFPAFGAQPTMSADGTNLTGTGAGVSVATTTSGTAIADAVQTITFTGTITGGTFTLTLGGVTTAAINWDAAPATLAANIQTALDALGVQAIVPDANSSTRFSATGLPTGLSINATTGVISGTIAAGAAANSPFTVTVTASDNGVSNTAQFTWTVKPIVTINSIADQQTLEGTAPNPSVTVVGQDSKGNTLTYTATGLPPGLTLNSSSGAISGTINNGAYANSPYHVTVTAKDQAGNSNSISFTWTVTPVVTIDTVATQNNDEGDNVTPVQIQAQDATNGATFTYNANGTLPPGLSINANGLISGTINAGAAAHSPYTVKITVTDNSNFSNTVTFTWNVAPVVTITKINNQTTPAGTSLSLQVSAQDANNKTLTYGDAGTLPPGLSINSSTGLISGKIDAADKGKTYHVTITATDTDSNQAQQTFTWKVT